MVGLSPNKKDMADKLLSEAMSVFFHLDPRRKGVVVPPQFKRESRLVLEFGLNMAVPIRDLEVTEEGIAGTLSFNRSPFWCFLPWKSVFAMVTPDHQGAIWAEDIPDEQLDAYLPGARKAARAMKLVKSVEDHRPTDGADEEQPARVSKRPKLAAVAESPGQTAEPGADQTSAKQDTQEEKASSDGGGDKRKLPSYLRVVK